MSMTYGDTDNQAFYIDGSNRTAIWTSSPYKLNLVRIQGGGGKVPEFTGNWGSYQKYNARPALYLLRIIIKGYYDKEIQRKLKTY